MEVLGKTLFFIGLIVCAIGLVLWSGVGRNWIGRLPGDIQYTRGNFSLYFPLATCLLLSAILTLLAWVFRR